MRENSALKFQLKKVVFDSVENVTSETKYFVQYRKSVIMEKRTS